MLDYAVVQLLDADICEQEKKASDERANLEPPKRRGAIKVDLPIYSRYVFTIDFCVNKFCPILFSSYLYTRRTVINSK